MITQRERGSISERPQDILHKTYFWKEEGKLYFNEKNNKTTSEPQKVLDILHKEAHAILSNPVQEPENQPEWYKEAYSWNAKNIDPEIWNELVTPLREEEVQDCFSEN